MLVPHAGDVNYPHFCLDLGGMTSVPVFYDHNLTIHAQRAAYLPSHPLRALVGGHKKDVVVTPRLAANPGHVAIYGWHR